MIKWWTFEFFGFCKIHIPFFSWVSKLITKPNTPIVKSLDSPAGVVKTGNNNNNEDQVAQPSNELDPNSASEDKQPICEDIGQQSNDSVTHNNNNNNNDDSAAQFDDELDNIDSLENSESVDEDVEQQSCETVIHHNIHDLQYFDALFPLATSEAIACASDVATDASNAGSAPSVLKHNDDVDKSDSILDIDESYIPSNMSNTSPQPQYLSSPDTTLGISYDNFGSPLNTNNNNIVELLDSIQASPQLLDTQHANFELFHAGSRDSEPLDAGRQDNQPSVDTGNPSIEPRVNPLSHVQEMVAAIENGLANKQEKEVYFYRYMNRIKQHKYYQLINQQEVTRRQLGPMVLQAYEAGRSSQEDKTIANDNDDNNNDGQCNNQKDGNLEEGQADAPKLSDSSQEVHVLGASDDLNVFHLEPEQETMTFSTNLNTPAQTVVDRQHSQSGYSEHWYGDSPMIISFDCGNSSNILEEQEQEEYNGDDGLYEVSDYRNDLYNDCSLDHLNTNMVVSGIHCVENEEDLSWMEYGDGFTGHKDGRCASTITRRIKDISKDQIVYGGVKLAWIGKKCIKKIAKKVARLNRDECST